MNYKRKNNPKGKGANNRGSRRRMRRLRANSDAFRDTMRDGIRNYKQGIAK